MRIRKLGFMNLEGKGYERQELFFVKPMGAKLFRVYAVPDKYQKEKHTEIQEVLVTLCSIERKGIFYFKITDREVMAEVGGAFELMDVKVVFAEADIEFLN